ncbi:MAG: hypothetical protein JXA42_23970 [Anaerolineales bacterium]|nr:hypothetical protein [Anaerolineales bacterium]
MKQPATFIRQVLKTPVLRPIVSGKVSFSRNTFALICGVLLILAPYQTPERHSTSEPGLSGGSNTPAGAAILKTEKTSVERAGPPATFPLQSTTGAEFQVTWTDNGATHPPEAETAFAYAAAIWCSFISSGVPIAVSVIWTHQPRSTPIATAAPTEYLRNFTGAPLVDTFYVVALANALAGADLAPGKADMVIRFDADVDWSFATDGDPTGSVDFVTIALHEMAHGLGFLGNMYESYNVGFCGNGPFYWYACPTPYDYFAVDSAGTPLLSYLESDPFTLGARLKSDARFGGPNTIVRYGESAPLHTPTIWQMGTSFSHFSTSVYGGAEFSLMLYSYSAGMRVPDRATLGVLQDLGWVLADNSPSLISSAPKAVGLNASADLIADLVWPDYTGQSITYQWTGTGQTPVTHTAASQTDSLNWSWDNTGVKDIQITATGADQLASASRTLLVFDVGMNGLTQGDTNLDYTFFANLTPSTTKLPATYTWQATGQTPVQHTDRGTSDSVVFHWTEPGEQTMTVTAAIGSAFMQAAHQILIEGLVLDHFIFLPLAIRQ